MLKGPSGMIHGKGVLVPSGAVGVAGERLREDVHIV
jgi:hypothetical protein